MKAFIGHSFNEKDAELIRDFKEFFESSGIDCVSGEKAQNTSIAIKVQDRIMECDLFVGIFTCDKAIASNPTEFTTSGCVYQESGFAIDAEKELIFLVEEGISKPFPALQGDRELIYFTRERLHKAYIKLSQMLETIKSRQKSESNDSKDTTILENQIIAKTTEQNDDSLAELELKVRKYISRFGYKILPNKHGFDICAKKTPWMDPDEYLAVGFNQNGKVTPSYVRDFLNKISEFNVKLKESVIWAPIMWPPILRGLIAYTGELPENVAQLTEEVKPTVKFNKF